MNTQTLFERALPYYIVAIAHSVREHFANKHSPIHAADVHRPWRTDVGKKTSLLGDEELFKAAINICADHKIIEPLVDPFGPLVFLKGASLTGGLAGLEQAYPQFNSYKRAGRTWLASALAEINKQRAQEWLSDRQDQKPNAAGSDDDDDDGVEVEEAAAGVLNVDGDEWAPLPVDRTAPALVKAERAVDEAVDALTGDNGYAATHPQERRWVLDSLNTFRSVLKREAQISLGYVRLCALDPLGRAIQRLGDSASGLIAMAARDAIKDWLKEAFKGVKDLIT